MELVVVDDNADARLLLETVLKRDGALTATCKSGQNALALIKTFLPDVVISDILMPGMDGYRFLGELRTLGTEQGGEVPVIALTAFARGGETLALRRRAFSCTFPNRLTPENLSGRWKTWFGDVRDPVNYRETAVGGERGRRTIFRESRGFPYLHWQLRTDTDNRSYRRVASSSCP